MSAQQLNVRVGLLFDEKSLANIERQMRSSGQRLSRIGTDLTLSLSLPLAAFGVAAIKAGGDIESLTLALKSQLGTAEAAAKELDLLTAAAKNPGLGVEQAVRGSVRLQGVGFAAEEARQVLIQMGNAIAATGGSAQELDNVTRQFAQMTSKGRVLQEDVSILSENMPGLAQLMQKAFGTQSVEAIRNMGVSGKEFVKQITKAAEELPRVEGGIKNGIGNAMDSLKQSAAKVGLAINQAFDVTGTIETVSGALLALAQGFASLDPAIQKTILGFGGMLIAIGPLIKAKGVLQTAGSQLIGVWSSMVGAGSFLGGAIKTITAAFNGLNHATKAFILVGLVYAVLQIAEAFGAFQQEATAAEKVQTSLNALSQEAEKSISSEKGAVERLIGVLNSETSSRDAKKAALAELNRISPEYFGNLRIENGAIVGLTSAYQAYIANLLLAAKAKKAEARLIEIDQQKTDLLKAQAEEQAKLNKLAEAKPVRRGGFGSDSDVLSSSASEAGAIANRINASKALVSQLELEEKGLTSLSQAGFEAVAKEKAAAAERAALAEKEAAAKAKALDAQSKGDKKLSESAKVLKEVLSDIANAPGIAEAIGDDADLATIKALEGGIRKLVDVGFKPASAEVQNLKNQLDSLKGSFVSTDIIKPGGVTPVTSENEKQLPDIQPTGLTNQITESQKALEAYTEAAAYASEVQQQLNDKTFNFQTGLSEVAADLLEKGNVIGAVFAGMGDAIAQSAAQGASSFAQLGQAAVGAAAKIIRAYIQQGVAAAVGKALSSVPFPFNLAAGAAAGAGAAALFTKAIGAIGVKGFARGTSNAPGGVALVGEQGPELINLPRGSQVFPTPQTNQMLSNMGGGNVSVGGEFTVRGTDLVLVLERAQQKNNRFR